MISNCNVKVALLTGGKDPHYALGLVSGLRSLPVAIDFIGNDEMQDSKFVKAPNVKYFNLRGDQKENVSIFIKIRRVLVYYFRLIQYATKSDARIFHILWINKFAYFDNTLLNLYYRIMGKKLVYTAHNVNIHARDGRDTMLNRLVLKFLYLIVNRVFVHTNQMKKQLISDFSVSPEKVTVIPFGINNVMPNTNLTRIESRQRLGLSTNVKTLLFFGNIAPYKGLEYLVMAARELKSYLGDFRLIIAGQVKNCADYWSKVERRIDSEGIRKNLIERIEYIPDREVEVFFKAADLLVLPYVHIFQTGVLFLSFQFGLPAVCTDVGSLSEEVIEGRNGFICRPMDPVDLSKKIATYFDSDLYNELESLREKIRNTALKSHSWDAIGLTHLDIYRELSPFGKNKGIMNE